MIYRHSLVVRLTHWINVLCVSLLMMSGMQILNAHPRLYWGAAGDDADRPFIEITTLDWRAAHPVGVVRIAGLELKTTGVLGVSSYGGRPVIRAFPSWLTLPRYQDLATGRRWHFFLAWLFVLNGLTYLVCSASSTATSDAISRRPATRSGRRTSCKASGTICG